jgi:hypothetical protein
MLTAKKLREAMHYDPATGVWTRIASKGRSDLVGTVCGSVDGGGYVHIRIDGQRLKSHRLAFLYMTGRFPKREVDHIDLDRTNNRWANLRVATRRQNQGNVRVRSDNVSRVKGVTKFRGRYQARIVLADGKREFIGSFVSATDAGRAYAEKARAVFCEYGRV